MSSPSPDEADKKASRPRVFSLRLKKRKESAADQVLISSPTPLTAFPSSFSSSSSLPSSSLSSSPPLIGISVPSPPNSNPSSSTSPVVSPREPAVSCPSPATTRIVESFVQRSSVLYGFSNLFYAALVLDLINLDEARPMLLQKDYDDLLKRSRSSHKFPTTSSKKIHKQVIGRMEVFLSLPEIEKKNWALIFYQRALESRRPLTSDNVATIGRVIAALKDCNFEKYSRALDSLTEYVAFHKDDPDNALIGMKPSAKLIEEFQKYQSGSEIIIPSSFTIEKIIQKIHKWAQLDDSDAGKKLKAFSRAFLHQDHKLLTKGDLVIYQQYTKILFGRFYEMKPDVSMIWNTFDERQTLLVNNECIIPLTPSARLCLGTPRMESLVHDDETDISLRIRNSIDSILRDFLTRNGINFKLLEECKNTCDISKKYDIVEICKKFEELESHIDEYLMAVNDEIQKMLHSIDHKMIFVFKPIMESGSYLKFASSRYKQFFSITNQSLEMVEIEIQKLIRHYPTVKRNFTRQSLRQIKKEVDEFLRDNNYAFDAISTEYIDQKPQCIDDVVKNFRILRSILDMYNDQLGFRQKLITPLREKIYQEYECFVNKVIFVLLELHLDVENVTLQAFDIDLFETAFIKAVENHQICSEYLQTYKDMLHDLHYISEMRQKDDDFDLNILSKKKFVYDSVPISGLIIGNVSRRFNEVKTVLEHFGNPAHRLLAQETRTVLRSCSLDLKKENAAIICEPPISTSAPNLLTPLLNRSKTTSSISPSSMPKESDPLSSEIIPELSSLSEPVMEDSEMPTPPESPPLPPPTGEDKAGAKESQHSFLSESPLQPKSPTRLQKLKMSNSMPSAPIKDFIADSSSLLTNLTPASISSTPSASLIQNEPEPTESVLDQQPLTTDAEVPKRRTAPKRSPFAQPISSLGASLVSASSPSLLSYDSNELLDFDDPLLIKPQNVFSFTKMDTLLNLLAPDRGVAEAEVNSLVDLILQYEKPFDDLDDSSDQCEEPLKLEEHKFLDEDATPEQETF